MSKEEKSIFHKKISSPNTSAFNSLEESNKKISDPLYVITSEIKQGNLNKAENLAKKYIELNPNIYKGWYILGDILRLKKRFNIAINSYKKALTLNSNLNKVFLLLALSYNKLKNYKQSEVYCLKFISKDPHNNSINALYASSLYNLKKFSDAKKFCEKDIKAKGFNKDNSNLMACILVGQQKYIEAEKYYKISATEKPINPEYVYNYATFLRIINKRRQAIKIYKDNLEVNPKESKTFKSLAEISPGSIQQKNIKIAKKFIQNNNNPTIQRVNFNFGLWELYSRTNKKEAFKYLKNANDLYKPEILKLINKTEYPYKEIEKNYNNIKKIFNSDILKKYKGKGNKSSIPIFIIGMPRSGTTLVEQILSNHPSITGGGELDFIFRIKNKIEGSLEENIKNLNPDFLSEIGNSYLESISKLIEKKTTGFTDKMPGNFLYLGLIHMILPNAKIIHVSRDPIDTCFSIYSKMFSSHHEYAYNLEDIGKHYKLYSSLMDYWHMELKEKIYNINYENLVTNINLETKNLLSFCNYEFNKNCISFHENSRPVTTASNNQVRKKLYSTSIGRWKHYKKELNPLIKILRA